MEQEKIEGFKIVQISPFREGAYETIAALCKNGNLYVRDTVCSSPSWVYIDNIIDQMDKESKMLNEQ